MMLTSATVTIKASPALLPFFSSTCSFPLPRRRSRPRRTVTLYFTFSLTTLEEMPAIKLFNVLALSTLAILLSSFAPSQTLALSLQSNHLARQLPNHHGISKKRKRGTQCKPRSSSTPAPVPTSTPLQDYTSLSSNSPQNDPSPSSTQSPNPVATNASNGSGKLAIAWALGDDSRVQILLAAPRVKMFHLWDANIPSALKASNMRTSIMLWGIDQQRISDFVAAAKPGYTDYVFGFNEYVSLIWFSFVP